MTAIYNARGNVYAVASPAELQAAGIPLPASPAEAACTTERWASPAINAFCGTGPAGVATKRHGTDGLLVGPFSDSPPFDVLIVNTDGTLAERSGNGLTIFSRALADNSLVAPGAPFVLHVHHDKPDAGSPTVTTVEMIRQADGQPAFWLDLGRPGFGPDAAGARGPGVQPSGTQDGSRVARLAEVNPAWTHSVFVRVGNPHCVTFLPDPALLPSMEAMHALPLHTQLVRIAFASSADGAGDPCPAGVNLQWAAPTGERRLAARVFERGEGPTASSGTSAAAVASAAYRQNLVPAGSVIVDMPGGSVPLELAEANGQLSGIRLLGMATQA